MNTVKTNFENLFLFLAGFDISQMSKTEIDDAFTSYWELVGIHDITPMKCLLWIRSFTIPL